MRFSLLFFRCEYLAIASPTTVSLIRKSEGGGLTRSPSDDTEGSVEKKRERGGG